MPANAIKHQLEKFGGGVLMSATISPMDVYTSISGVSELKTEVAEQEYPLRFPDKNRESVIVPLTKFTKGNREGINSSNTTREKYKQALLDVVNNVEGNTLICMPSYEEAKWVEDAIGTKIPNPIYVDESSTNDETMALKKAFETQDDGILVTSLRGTLTEGVDYSGDKLSNVVVVGVPLTYPYSNRAEAIQTAYAVKFGRKNAFDYALSVPAVYKTRQAIGRVIRGDKEVGTRILIDERYTDDHHQSVNEYLSTQQQNEFTEVEADSLADVLSEFWQSV
jgi:DNA excision repair protein ERCC-2